MITATLRRRKRDRLKRAENVYKQEVRDRDVVCRFPLCPCRYVNLFLEVSHRVHKGMGGDPTGELSRPAAMLLVCNWRHKEDRFSIDKHGIRWDPLTPFGANGPIVWLIDLGKFDGGLFPRGTWVELAREVEPGRLAPLTPQQRQMLDHLGSALKKRFR